MTKGSLIKNGEAWLHIFIWKPGEKHFIFCIWWCFNYSYPLLPFSLLVCHLTAKKEEGPATGHKSRGQEIQRVQVLGKSHQEEASRENWPGQEMKEEVVLYFNSGGCRLLPRSSVSPVAIITLLLFLFGFLFLRKQWIYAFVSHPMYLSRIKTMMLFDVLPPNWFINYQLCPFFCFFVNKWSDGKILTLVPADLHFISLHNRVQNVGGTQYVICTSTIVVLYFLLVFEKYI